MNAERSLGSARQAPVPLNTPLGTTVKYNPHLWGDDELRAIFVVRQPELADLLDAVRRTPATSMPQHRLIVGQRGMGKTTLLRRLALAIRDDADLSRDWLALTFPEEQYTVSTLGELWRNVLDALADALEDGGAPAAELAALDKTIAGIDDLPLAQREDAALALLIDWIARQQRRVVLLIDSSDLLFATLAGNSKAQVDGRGLRVGDADATPLWRLRKTLTHQPGLFWIGASYQALEAEHAYHAAFHDFFQLVELRPLNSEQMRQALLALARTFGFDGQQGDAAAVAMAQRLDARPERLQALRTMTGGNPRTTVILFDLFAANADGNVHSDLRGLLDLMTPLYKARMEALADQPRKLLAHLMEAWAPQTAGELAAVAGLPVTTVSGQLSRLESDGLIEKVRLPGRRRNGYQAGERFFNIWYLMRLASRRLRQRLTWLIEFMRLWFSTPERLGLAQARAERHRHGQISDDASLEYSRALAGTLPAEHAQRCRLEWSVFTAARQNARAALGELFDLDGTEREFATADDYLQRFAALDAGLQRCPSVGDEEMAAWVEAVKGSLSLSLAEKESIADAAPNLNRFQVDELRKLFADELTAWQALLPVAAVTVVRQATLDGQFFPDCPDAKLAYTQLQAAFGDNPAAYLFGLDLFLNRHSDTWVEKAYRRAIELDATLASPWNGLGNLLCDPLQRYAEAEAAYRRAIELDATNAWPWNGLGNLLKNHLQRYAEAEAAYRRAIELDATYAWPWNNLGNLLQDHLQRYAEAEAAYRRAIELDATYAWPWNNLGNLLQDHLQRYAEAEAAYRRAIELDATYASPWIGLGNLLCDPLQRYAEAEAAYRRAIELDATDASPWIGLGNLLANHLQRYAEAEAAYRRAIELDATLASPWNGLGNLLANHLQRYAEAEAAYRRAIELDATDALPWNNLGNLLCDPLQRYAEAEAAYRRAIELDATDAWPWIGLGNLLQDHLQRYAEAEAAYRRAIELDATDASPWNGLGNLLANHLQRYAEAEAAYRRAIELDATLALPWNDLGNLLKNPLQRYAEAEAAYRRAIELDATLAWPWNNLGNLLCDHLQRYAEAEAAYRRAIELDATYAVPWNNLGNLLQDHLQRYAEAEAAYRRAIELDATYAVPWYNLGNLLQDPLQRYAEAEAAYRRAIELDATYAWPWNNLGKLLCDPLQRYAEAEAAYRRAIELDAADALPWIGLGNLLKNHLQRYAEAEAAYRRAIELDATYAWPWNGLGNLLCDPLQRYAEAEAAYRRAMDIDEAEPYPVLNLARLLASQGRNDEAAGLYRQAVPLAEKSLRRVGSASGYLALILQAQLWLGNRDAAEQAFAELGKNAAQGDAHAFFRLREQVTECRQLGLGAALARLIDDSAYADFLQPLSLALREASGEEALDVAPAEVAALAGEVRAAIDAGPAAPNVRR